MSKPEGERGGGEERVLMYSTCCSQPRHNNPSAQEECYERKKKGEKKCGDGREVSAGVEKREVEGKLRRPGRRGGR